MNGEAARLTAELEAAVVRALRSDWERINYAHFRDAMRLPVLLLSASEGRLGRWSSADRTIEIGRQLVMEQPWAVVVEVLKHEMAHQYVHEVLGAHDETAHGAAFRSVCERLDIDATASGMPRPRGALPDEEGRALGRIAKLLALAESENRHEAELAMREAQRLMLKHNIDAAKTGRRGDYGFRHLGAPTGRLQPQQRVLASILGEHFFVETIWVSVHRPFEGKPGTVLEVCGTEPNLEMASYVHDFLLRTAEHLWQSHKRASGIRGDADRRSYLVGVMRGFRDKLDEDKRVQRTEGLVWVGDRELSRYFRRRYPRQRSVYSNARADPAAFAAGQKAGRSIVIHRPVTAGPRGGARLLTGR
jgi:hypothetical protein